MNAGAKDSLLASVVNNAGVIEARTVDDRDGVIALLGGMTTGTIELGGTLDASAANGGRGGSAETSAAHVKVADSATVTADPGYSGTVTGFVAGDTQTSATMGSESFTTGALLHSNIGLYGISGSGLTADNGNYVFVEAPSNATALTITPVALTVASSLASDKVYNGTLAATVTGGTLVGTVFGDSLTLTQSGTFAAKYVGTGLAVTASDSLGGSSAGNYTLTQPLGLAANITPATLTYFATPTSRTIGGTPSVLSGSVTGFVLDDTQNNAASGTLTWQTAAGPNVPPGHYAVDGEGSSATNYVFDQAPGNATAMAVMPAVPNGSTVPVQPSVPSILIRSVVTQIDGVLPGSTSDFDMEIEKLALRSSPLPTLQIVDGGVKVPPKIMSSFISTIDN